jgi:hypothetical protein
VREVQELCPKALFIHFSNPESRIILVFARHFEIQLPKPIAIDCGSVDNKFGAIESCAAIGSVFDDRYLACYSTIWRALSFSRESPGCGRQV